MNGYVRLNYIKSGPDGGREALAMRVHPKTRELWVGTACYGLWKLSAPGGATATAQRKPSAPDKQPAPVKPVVK